MKAGHVSLVGAGPGDPGLLTRTAIARLRAADLVLYDALVDDRNLRYARRAQRFYVGKRAGKHAMTQTAIQALLVRAARRGKRVVRRDGVTIAISTSGDAPALTALLREGLDALLPRDLAAWVWRARAERVAWRRDGVPMEQRKPLLLRALNSIYGLSAEPAANAEHDVLAIAARSAAERGPRIPWLSAPEDSWL